MGDMTREVRVKPRAEERGSYQVVKSAVKRVNKKHWDEFDGESREVLPEDCGERRLVLYSLIRTIRDVYVNCRSGGGKSGAYRKQCRMRRKEALSCILSQSEEVFSWNWSCKALGYNPEVLRRRVIFDIHDVTTIVQQGFAFGETINMGKLRRVRGWTWEETPERYRLADKKGHFVLKMSASDAETWIENVSTSILEFSIQRNDLTTGEVILTVRHV